MNQKLTVAIAVDQYAEGLFEVHIRVKGGSRSQFYKTIETLRESFHCEDISWMPKLKVWRGFFAADTTDSVSHTSKKEFEDWMFGTKAIAEDRWLELYATTFPRDEGIYDEESYDEQVHFDYTKRVRAGRATK